jgi:glycosyltransferase involved in cell wall biosynthesis
LNAARIERVAVLRSTPKDAAFGKVLTALLTRYAVDCYIWDRQRDFVPMIQHPNLRYHRCTVRAGYYSVGTLFKLVLFELWLFFKLLFAKVQYIHALELDAGVIGLCIAKLRRKPLIYHCLDPYSSHLPLHWPQFLAGWAKRLENLVISAADLFVITDRLRMPQHAGAHPTRVVEFPNVPYIDVSGLQKPPGGAFVVGYIGTLMEGRNLLTIVEAVGELADQGVRLVIGGYGHLERAVAERARHYHNVSYTGWIPYPEVLRLESSFDVFVYTIDPKRESQRWASPNKLFESMALGRPMIVAKGTLAAERVSAIGNGVMVNYGSKDELQSAIMQLKNDVTRVQEMGEKGRREFTSNWSWEIMEKRLLDAYGGLHAG